LFSEWYTNFNKSNKNYSNVWSVTELVFLRTLRLLLFLLRRLHLLVLMLRRLILMLILMLILVRNDENIKLNLHGFQLDLPPPFKH
jgi:uncharacterized integral membrane protein